MSNNNGSTIVAVLAGVAIGAGIGILFAPDKGSKTRGKIKDGFDEAKHNLSDKLNEVTDKISKSDILGKVDIDHNYEKLVSNISHKTEDVISFLENKLALLKEKNAKLQK
jgi:gas vesicle protein